MSSLSAKDRVSLCQFTFSDGRRCRSLRNDKNSRLCFDHAQKEARARATESLTKDLGYFFSADYLSACDLSTALGRLIPAVLRGDVKPRAARTVAYMAQTLLQTIRMAQDEYINTFGTDGWRKSIRNSVNDNYNYRFPQAAKPESPQLHPQPAAPQPQPPASQPGQTPVNCHSEPSAQREESASSSASSSSNSPLVTHHSFTPSEAEGPLPPAPSPHTPLPPTSAEFAQQLLASLKTDAGQAPQPAEAPACSHSDAVAQAFRPEESAFSSLPTPSPTSARTPQTPAPPSNLNPPASTTANTPPIPATQSATPPAPVPDPVTPQQSPATRQSGPNRDTPWWDSSHLYDPPDSHLL